MTIVSFDSISQITLNFNHSDVRAKVKFLNNVMYLRANDDYHNNDFV